MMISWPGAGLMFTLPITWMYAIETKIIISFSKDLVMISFARPVSLFKQGMHLKNANLVEEQNTH